MKKTRCPNCAPGYNCEEGIYNMDGKYICRRCTEEKPPGERFKVPATELGESQMKNHLWNVHRVNIDMNSPDDSELWK